MTVAELRGLLHSIDTALAIFQNHSGALAATDISIKSMLVAMRVRVLDELERSIVD